MSTVRVDTQAVRALGLESGQLGQWLLGKGRQIVVDAVAAAPLDEGELRALIGPPRVEQSARGPVLVVPSRSPHSVFVHQGTRPHFPPVAALEGWARRHGFPNAYLVARVIAERGTRAVPFLLDAGRRYFPSVRSVGTVRR